jgi:hypothetical protein
MKVSEFDLYRGSLLSAVCECGLGRKIITTQSTLPLELFLCAGPLHKGPAGTDEVRGYLLSRKKGPAMAGELPTR